MIRSDSHEALNPADENHEEKMRLWTSSVSDMKPTEKRPRWNSLTFMDFIAFLCLKPIFIDFLLLKSWFYTPSPVSKLCRYIIRPGTPETGSSPSDLDSAFASLGSSSGWVWDHHNIGRLDHVLHFLAGIADSLWEVLGFPGCLSTTKKKAASLVDPKLP